MANASALLDGRYRGTRSADLPPLRQLRRIRKVREMQQTELARAVRCSPALISLLESGYRPRTLALVDAIAAALGVKPQALTAPRLKVLDAGGAVFIAGKEI
jgi:transcriptional regulator with XRE-family HTH domain